MLFKGEHEGAELSMPKLLSVSSSCLSYSLYADTTDDSMKLGCVIVLQRKALMICGSSTPTPHRLAAVVATACVVNECGGVERTQLWEDMKFSSFGRLVSEM